MSIRANLVVTFHQTHGVHHVAPAFIFDARLTLIVLTAHLARQPRGRVHWPWFVAFSLIGGWCFGLPFYWWLNGRAGGRSPAGAA